MSSIDDKLHAVNAVLAKAQNDPAAEALLKDLHTLLNRPLRADVAIACLTNAMAFILEQWECQAESKALTVVAISRVLAEQVQDGGKLSVAMTQGQDDVAH